MTTPEGHIKIKVRGLLRKYNCYFFQPVQTGYGIAGLDFHCMTAWNSCAIAFFIEAKKPDGVLTPRQIELISNLRSKWGANVFVIKNEEGLRRLEQWLLSLKDQSTLLKPRVFKVETSSPTTTSQ
jgi:hypothetical protein